MEGIRNGYLFPEKWSIKGQRGGGDLGADPPRIKFVESAPPGAFHNGGNYRSA